MSKKAKEVTASRTASDRRQLRFEAQERPPLGLVVPLYDEQGNVETVSRELLDAFAKAEVPLTLVLVDNGSRDNTRIIVQELELQNPSVLGIYLDKNEGYGGGILRGMQEIAGRYPLVGYMWGDGQIHASDVLRVYRRLVAEGADVAKVRRVQRRDGWKRAMISGAYNTLNLWFFHVTSTDANGCPKLFTAESWERLSPSHRDWFLDDEVMINLARQNMKLAEVDVVAEARKKGKSKVGAATVLEFCANFARRRFRP